jgi:hypothetical protein
VALGGLFYDVNGTPIHSASYWNSGYTYVDSANLNSFLICSGINTCLNAGSSKR